MSSFMAQLTCWPACEEELVFSLVKGPANEGEKGQPLGPRDPFDEELIFSLVKGPANEGEKGQPLRPYLWRLLTPRPVLHVKYKEFQSVSRFMRLRQG